MKATIRIHQIKKPKLAPARPKPIVLTDADKAQADHWRREQIAEKVGEVAALIGKMDRLTWKAQQKFDLIVTHLRLLHEDFTKDGGKPCKH